MKNIKAFEELNEKMGPRYASEDSLYKRFDVVYEDFIALYTLLDEGVLDRFGKLQRGNTAKDAADELNDQDLGGAFSKVKSEEDIAKAIADLQKKLKAIAEYKKS